MNTQTLTIEWVKKSITHADNWRKKGNFSRENSCLESSLKDYLNLAGKSNADSASACAWLSEHSFHELLQRYYRNLCELAAKVEAGELPSSVITGNYSYVTLAHVCWALDDYPLGEQFVQFARRADVLELSTPFWKEYSKALECLVSGAPYEVLDITPKGEEKYWYEYLNLISDITHNHDLSSSLARINVAFEKRNRDKSIDDWYSVEGSGHEPAKWHWRKESLLRYSKNRS